MDQVKTGNFLKELRKEKNLTQEQLAEILGWKKYRLTEDFFPILV